MDKLTQRERNGIINRAKRKEKISDLAERYGVSRQTISKIIKEYKTTGNIPTSKKKGRKRKELTEYEKELIRKSAAEASMGADGLEKYIGKTYHVHISHNKIHEYLLSINQAVENPRKKRQRKYRRYQRHHSMSLWHTDWKEFIQDGERKYLTVFIDDRSRFITCYGVFDAMTTENSLLVLERGIMKYGCPDQIVTDNGSQYCSVLSDNPLNHGFGKYLSEHNIRHIRSRVSHPQTNGKVERFFREVDAKIETMKSIDEIVRWQNYVKLHKSLDWRTPESVFYQTQDPAKIFDKVKSWFWTPLDECALGNDKM